MPKPFSDFGANLERAYDNALKNGDIDALGDFLVLGENKLLAGHWYDMDKLLAVFLSSENLTQAALALESDGTLGEDECARARRIISGARMACFIWSNPAGMAHGAHYQPAPQVRHHFRRILSWISLFFEHSTSPLLDDDTLVYASHTLDKIVFEDQEYRDVLGQGVYADFLRNVFLVWLSAVQNDTPREEALVYILTHAVIHLLSRKEDRGRDLSHRDALSHRFSPYIESHADEVARALVDALLSRGCISDIGNSERPVLLKWEPLLKVFDFVMPYPQTFHALLRANVGVAFAGHIRRLSRGEFEREPNRASWTYLLRSACITANQLVCGPAAVLQMLEARLLPSLIRLDDRVRITALEYASFPLYPSTEEIRDNISMVLTMICGYARIPSFLPVFRRSFAAIDRMMASGEMVLSTKVQERLQEVRGVFDFMNGLWPQLSTYIIRCSNPTCLPKPLSVKDARRCGGCKKAHYCSDDCQRRHWKAGDHREQCPRLREVALTVSPYQPLNSIDLSVLHYLCYLRRNFITEHWDFIKGSKYDQMCVDLIDLVVEDDISEEMAGYQRFRKHDLSHWDELAQRRAPGDAAGISINANGWPLEITSLERVKAMRVEVQYFGQRKYGS